jgi:hypothetical protein
VHIGPADESAMLRLPRWRVALPWVALALVALGAAALRYGLIEPSEMGQLCAASDAPRWCAWRQALVLGFLAYAYGYAALAATALALLWKHPFAAWLAAALGAFALQLYCVEAGAFALLLGSLRLLRWQADRLPPRGEHRHGERQVQAQP